MLPPTAPIQFSSNGGNSMQSAQAMWKMLDDMAASDPEEYDNFLKSQMQGMDGGGVAAVTPKESEVPLAAFCSLPERERRRAASSAASFRRRRS